METTTQGIYRHEYINSNMFNDLPDRQIQVGTMIATSWVAYKNGIIWKPFGRYPASGFNKATILEMIVEDQFRMLTWGGRDDVGSTFHWIQQQIKGRFSIQDNRDETYTIVIGNISVTAELGRAALIAVMTHKGMW